MYKTYFPTTNEPKWVLVDANGQTLGRLATRIATILRGKHKADYTPSMANGDFVIVINASKVALTGNKLDDKFYTRYTGYQGGLKVENTRTMLTKHPERVIEHAVYGMLPKGRLGRRLHSHLKVYAGETHPHAAQTPRAIDLGAAREEVKK
ncbi:MAG TPA: 50S ribosomal protein L13 [Deinococcales bacterium]|nr:50S ribosomal protein L13 [Deinococcales bacterium]